jgi:hypothetical protein
MYNLHFNIGSPAAIKSNEELKDSLLLPLDFLRLAREIYKQLESVPGTDIKNRRVQLMRKIISIVVMSTANAANHANLVTSKFFAHLKQNLNRKYALT